LELTYEIGAVFLGSSNYNNIIGNEILITSSVFLGDGISLEESDFNTITQNNISLCNRYGIYLLSSSENSIFQNNISLSAVGINLTNSSSNRIFHNNIIDNTEQAYDDSDSSNFWNHIYPIGGNYWSDYSGNDIYKGPNQDQPGSDNIGDTPYIIDIDSLDFYPLMQPFQFYNGTNYPPVITTEDDKTAYVDATYIVDYGK
jgi:parallel beta-helix repeat protein